MIGVTFTLIIKGIFMNTNRLFFFLSIALLFSCAKSTLKCMEDDTSNTDNNMSHIDLSLKCSAMMFARIQTLLETTKYRNFEKKMKIIKIIHNEINGVVNKNPKSLHGEDFVIYANQQLNLQQQKLKKLGIDSTNKNPWWQQIDLQNANS